MEKEIEQVNSKALGSNYTRSAIKDKAADMVVGLDKDNIEDYNPESSKKNKILNRVFKRYTRKYNNDKFLGLPYKEVLKLSPKEQERWFAAKNTQVAGPMFSGMTAVAGLPILMGDLAATPVLTTAGLVNGLTGGYIGSTIGEKRDERRHNITNNKFVGEMVGGIAGAMFPKQIERDLVWPATPEQRAKADQIYKSSYSKNTNQNLDVAIFDTPILSPNASTNIDPSPEEFFTMFEQNFHMKPVIVPYEYKMAAIDGINRMRQFAASESVLKANKYNEELFGKLGLNSTKEDLFFIPTVVKPHVRFENFNDAGIHGVHAIRADKWPQDQRYGAIFLNGVNTNASNVRDAAFHEAGHNFRWQQAKTSEGVFAQQWKMQKALKPVSELHTPQERSSYKYLTTENEGVINFAEIGNALGIKPGQARPSKEEYYQYVERAKEVIPEKAHLLELINPKKWYRGWDLLTGQYKRGGKVKRCIELMKKLNHDK